VENRYILLEIWLIFGLGEDILDTPTKIRWHIALTPEDKELCYSLRSQGYRRYYRHIPPERFADEFDEELLADGQPRTLNVLVYENDQPVATTRVSLVSHTYCDDMQLQSDIQFLYDVPSGIREKIHYVMPEMSYVQTLLKWVVLPL